MKTLIIVESPNKAKTVSHYAREGYNKRILQDKNIESNHGRKGVNRANEWKIISPEQNPIPRARYFVVAPNESTLDALV